jgi:hypothetical protein
MKTFTFRITQNAVGYFEGKIDIEAFSENAAINKLKKLQEEELEGLVYGWTTSELISDGRIEVWNNGKLVN